MSRTTALNLLNYVVSRAQVIGRADLQQVLNGIAHLQNDPFSPVDVAERISLPGHQSQLQIITNLLRGVAHASGSSQIIKDAENFATILWHALKLTRREDFGWSAPISLPRDRILAALNELLKRQNLEGSQQDALVQARSAFEMCPAERITAKQLGELPDSAKNDLRMAILEEAHSGVVAPKLPSLVKQEPRIQLAWDLQTIINLIGEIESPGSAHEVVIGEDPNTHTSKEAASAAVSDASWVDQRPSIEDPPNPSLSALDGRIYFFPQRSRIKDGDTRLEDWFRDPHIFGAPYGRTLFRAQAENALTNVSQKYWWWPPVRKPSKRLLSEIWRLPEHFTPVSMAEVLNVCFSSEGAGFDIHPLKNKLLAVAVEDQNPDLRQQSQMLAQILEDGLTLAQRRDFGWNRVSSISRATILSTIDALLERPTLKDYQQQLLAKTRLVFENCNEGVVTLTTIESLSRDNLSFLRRAFKERLQFPSVIQQEPRTQVAWDLATLGQLVRAERIAARVAFVGGATVLGTAATGAVYLARKLLGDRDATDAPEEDQHGGTRKLNLDALSRLINYALESDSTESTSPEIETRAGPPDELPTAPTVDARDYPLDDPRHPDYWWRNQGPNPGT